MYQSILKDLDSADPLKVKEAAKSLQKYGNKASDAIIPLCEALKKNKNKGNTVCLLILKTLSYIISSPNPSLVHFVLPFDLKKSVVDALSDALLNHICEKVRVEAIIALGKIYPSLKNKELQEKMKFTLKLARLKSKIPSMVREKVVKEIKKEVPNFPRD